MSIRGDRHMRFHGSQRGYSFLEVLVAMVVLGIAVLAFAGLQIRALDTSGTSHVRAQAMSLASDLLERARANVAGAATYRDDDLYDGGDNPDGPPVDWANTCIRATNIPNLGVAGDGCTPQDLARFDIHEVEFSAANLLPLGRVLWTACPAAGAAPECIFVSWGGTNPLDCDDNATPNCVMMQAVIE